MFVEETVIPGGFGGGIVTDTFVPAYGLGGFGAPMGVGCCPVGGCVPCVPCVPCMPCCYPGVYYWSTYKPIFIHFYLSYDVLIFHKHDR